MWRRLLPGALHKAIGSLQGSIQPILAALKPPGAHQHVRAQLASRELSSFSDSGFPQVWQQRHLGASAELPSTPRQPHHMLPPSLLGGVRTVKTEPGAEYWADVFNQLSDVNQEPEAKTMSPTSFELLEIRDDGSILNSTHTPASLELHSRDVSVFTSKRIHASISLRGRSIFFMNEFVRAVIMRDKVVIFPCGKRRHMVSVAEAITARLGTHGNRNPFELNVIEALLSSSVNHFYSRARQLDLLVNIITSNTQALASPDFQTMLPLQHTVSETYQDIKEFQEATAEALKDDKTAAAMCLSTTAGEATWQQPRHTAELEEVLSSYQLQIQVIEGMFEEMQDMLSNARDITRMQMSSRRNYYVQTNLVISIANLALLNCTIVSGFFGMNLHHGLEEVPGVFPLAVGGAMAASGLAFWGVYTFVAWRPFRNAQESIRQLSAIRSLVVNHIDDIGDIVSYSMKHTLSDDLRTRKLGREQFHQIAWDATKRRSKPMSAEEVDLLFDFFDGNKNGFVEAQEMEAMYTKLVEQPESISSVVGAPGGALKGRGGYRKATTSLDLDDYRYD